MNWVRLIGSFTADSAYDNIVVGGFLPSSSVGVTPVGSPGVAYYYVDSVVVTPHPIFDAILNDSVFCSGDTVKVPFTVAGKPFGSSNVYSLQLSSPTGSFTSPATVATVSGNGGGLLKWVIPASVSNGAGYRLRVKTTNPVDSFLLDPNIIIGNTVPAKPIASSNTPVCYGDSLKLTSSSATTGVNYTWTGPSFTSNSQNPFIVSSTFATAGQYIVTAWLYGCKSKDTTTVTIKSVPGYTATYNSPICQPDTLKITTTSTFSTATYNWTGPNSFSSTLKNPVRPNTAWSDSGYYVGIASFNGCNYKDSIKVNIKPQPQNFSASSNSPQCQGSTLNLIGSTTSSGVTWAWTGPNSFSSTSQSPSISSAQPTHSGNYYLTATLNGCSIKDTEAVSIIAIPPTPVPTANTPVCVGQTLNLSAGIAAPGYLWSGPGSFVSTSQTPAINNATTAVGGTYSVRSVDGGCTSPAASINVAVISAPTASMYPSPKDSICQGAPVNFFASSSNAGTSPVYHWYHNNGFISGATNSSYNTNTTSDYDTYFCTVTSNGTCATPFTDTSNVIQMRVFPWLAPSVSIIATPTGTVKGGDLINFTATPVNGGNTPGYQWMRNNKPELGALSYTWGAKTLSDKDVVCVTMTSSYLCPQPKTANSNCITVSVDVTGVNDTKLQQVNVYPNPVNDRLVIEHAPANSKLQLADVYGRLLYKADVHIDKTEINTSQLSAGNYVLILTDKDGNRNMYKVEKE